MPRIPRRSPASEETPHLLRPIGEEEYLSGREPLYVTVQSQPEGASPPSLTPMTSGTSRDNMVSASAGMVAAGAIWFAANVMHICPVSTPWHVSAALLRFV